MKWLRAASALVMGRPITTAYFGSPAIARWVKALVKSRPIDRAIVYSTAMAPYILDSSGFDPARVVFDMQDVDSDKWRQYAATARWPERWIFQREAKKLLDLERLSAAKFGVTTLVSSHEAASFCGMAPESASRICALNHGVELHGTPGGLSNPFPPGEIPIVMTGRMDYRPNADGAAWFANEVMPHIVPALPHARFYIVGANPVRSLRRLAGPRIVVTGQVDDVRPYVWHAAVAVAPLKMARGVQNKVLEAMAMLKPMIATPEATRALAVTSGVELWIESTPLRFAAAVVHAMSAENREEVALRGREYVERNYDWQKNLTALDDMLAQLGNRPTQDAPLRDANAAAGEEQARHRFGTSRASLAGVKR
jgi:sugar transferase (PEP-CTERM/EpsH1 system associated)